MRTLTIWTLVLGGLSLLQLAPALATGEPGATTLPRAAVRTLPKAPVVMVVGRSPLTVSGWRFAPGEKVVVTVVRAPAPRNLTAAVDRNGRFFVRFADVSLARCAEPRVTVRSQRGLSTVRGGLPGCRAAD